jgi:hypothetical protein
MKLKSRHFRPKAAFALGAIVGLFWIFMLARAMGLDTGFTAITEWMAILTCPVIPIAFLSNWAWVFVVLLNGGLYALIAILVAKFAAARQGTQI